MKIVACIPARYASTRLPGKPLCDIHGKPMIIHVCERASRASGIDQLVVLTDDERIANTVEEFGYTAIMTSTDCRCGTERIIEFMADSDGEVFVNIQGDEVLLEPTHVERLVEALKTDNAASMATLAHRVSDASILSDPTTAKVVIDAANHALYFSRHCIPVQQSGELPSSALVQIGVYAYRRRCLQVLSVNEPSPLEEIEKLEQLRALHLGLKIHIAEVDATDSLSVDTQQDLDKAREYFSRQAQ